MGSYWRLFSKTMLSQEEFNSARTWPLSLRYSAKRLRERAIQRSYGRCFQQGKGERCRVSRVAYWRRSKASPRLQAAYSLVRSNAREGEKERRSARRFHPHLGFLKTSPTLATRAG